MDVRRAAWLSLPGVCTTTIPTGVSILVAEQTLSGAAFVASSGAVGFFVGSAAATRLLPRLPMRRPALLLSVLWAMGALLSLVVSAWDPSRVLLLSAAAVLMVGSWAVLSVLLRDVVSTWGEGWLRRVGPTSRVGAALGALLASGVVSQGLPLLLLALTVPLVWVSPALRYRADLGHGAGRAWSWSVFAANAAFALVATGPIVLHVALVVAVAGPQWVGVSMAVYAAAGLIAPPLVHRLPSWCTSSPTAWLALSAIADASWLLCLIAPGPGLLVSRAASALALFAAEGSADVASQRVGAQAAALSGRAGGIVVSGAFGTAFLAWGVPALGVPVLFAAASAVAAAASGALAVRNARSRSQ